MRAPRERSRTLVRLVPCVWVPVAAVPPDTFCFAAVPLWRCPLLPCWLMPELPCWLPELPCCLAPVLEPDCMPESCACALETASRIGRHWGGDSENCRGPEHHCEYSHFFLLRRASPQDNRPRTLGFRAQQKLWMNGCLSCGRADALRPVDHHHDRFARCLTSPRCTPAICSRTAQTAAVSCAACPPRIARW